MKWGLGAFRNSVYKAHAQAFPFFFFPFFSSFLFYFPFFFFFFVRFCWLGSAICIYRAYISRTHIILRVRRPSVVPYSVSAVAKGGGGIRRRRRLRPRLCLSPSARFGSALFIKKKQQKYVGKNKKCFVLSGLRFCSILFGATTKKFYLCPIYESGNALACVCLCEYFLLTS